MLNMIKNINKTVPQASMRALFCIAFLAILAFPFMAGAAFYDAPSVSTISATNIDTDSAVLYGYADGNGRSTKVWFEYGRTTSMTSTTSKTSIGSDDEEFHKTISNLREDTIYYFQAVAENSEGTTYGSMFSLRTDGDYSSNNYYDQNNCQNYYSDCYQDNLNQNNTVSLSPTANTNVATDIGSQTVQLNSLIINGRNSASNAWFEWGTTPSLGNKTNQIPVGSTPSVKFVNVITGLTPNTVYYFRAVAENSYFRNNGQVLSFVTAPGASTQYYYPAPTVQPPTPAPIITPVKNTVVPAEAEPVINKDVKTSGTSYLGANVFGAGTFFPGNVLGWLVLIILVLILVSLLRHPQVFGKSDHHDNGSSGHH